MEPFGYIYLITCNISQKKYVGQTVLKNPFNRWTIHKSAARGNRTKQYLHKAIRKYGEENFSFEILCPVYSKSELDSMEISYITSLNTLSPLGYNTAIGGSGHSGEYTPERRQKISATSKGRRWSEEQKTQSSQRRLAKHRHCSEETKRKISKANKGRGGWHHTEETKQKLAASSKQQAGWHHTEESLAKIKTRAQEARGRKILCMETQQVFNCIKDADRWLLATTGRKGYLQNKINYNKDQKEYSANGYSFYIIKAN